MLLFSIDQKYKTGVHVPNTQIGLRCRTTK